MTGLALAVRFLTIVPLPGRTAHDVDALGRAAVWFPVVGLGIGFVLVGVERVTSVLFPSLLAALLTVTAWKVLTGGLHLDGLADCLDGLVLRGEEEVECSGEEVHGGANMVKEELSVMWVV